MEICGFTQSFKPTNTGLQDSRCFHVRQGNERAPVTDSRGGWRASPSRVLSSLARAAAFLPAMRPKRRGTSAGAAGVNVVEEAADEFGEGVKARDCMASRCDAALRLYSTRRVLRIISLRYANQKVRDAYRATYLGDVDSLKGETAGVNRAKMRLRP
jgi:hypothetical protein